MWRIFTLALVFCFFGSAQPKDVTPPTLPNMYILVAGVNSGADSDAEDSFIEEANIFDSALMDSSVGCYNVNKVKVTGKKLTKQRFLEEIRNLARLTTAKDKAIIYLTAHGGDYEGTYSCSLSNESAYDYELKLTLCLFRCPTIFYVDTCHAGAMAREFRNCNSLVQITSVCRADETAAVFGYCNDFADSFKYADYNNDGFIDSDESNRYVAAKIAPNQNMTYSTMSRQNFILGRKKRDNQPKEFALADMLRLSAEDERDSDYRD